VKIVCGCTKDEGRSLGVGLQAQASTQNNPWKSAMIINEIKYVLLWCTGLNYTVLFIWFGVFVFAHDWMYRMHGRWFKLSVETFDTIHYACLAIYKIGILLLNLVPLIALYLAS